MPLPNNWQSFFPALSDCCLTLRIRVLRFLASLRVCWSRSWHLNAGRAWHSTQFPYAKHVANSILIRAAAAAAAVAMAMAMAATISSQRRVAVNAYFIFSFHWNRHVATFAKCMYYVHVCILYVLYECVCVARLLAQSVNANWSYLPANKIQYMSSDWFNAVQF